MPALLSPRWQASTHWTIPPFNEEPRLSVTCTLLVPANILRPPDDIETSVTHRLHCAMPLSGNVLCYPSKMAHRIVVKLAFSHRHHFFNRGFAISYPIIWKTENAGDYPIGIHHPWHVTNGSSVDAVSGRR